MTWEDLTPLSEETRFHGVSAPAWEDDRVLAEILRKEAADEREWFGSARDQALLLTVADRIELLISERTQAERSIKDQEAMQVEIFDLRTTILDLTQQNEKLMKALIFATGGQQ